MWWKVLIFIVLIWVTVGAWIFPAPTPVQNNPDAFRIIYFHFPMAIATVVGFGAGMYYSIRYLTTKQLKFDLRAFTMAKLGVIFCVLAAITGSIFAKQTWGSYWNWDPRETSIFMLLLVYGAYMALRSAISDPGVKANLSAVYSIFGFIATIFFIFVMPRMMPGLHPGAPKPTGASDGSVITFSAATASVLIPSVIAYIGLLFWVNNLSVTIDEIKEDYSDE